MEITAQYADTMNVMETLEPIVFFPDRPSEELVLEVHQPEHSLEVSEAMPTADIVVPELPGVKQLDPMREQTLEVSDNATIESNQTHEAKDEDQSPWGWEKVLKESGCEGFLAWVKERLDAVPRHSGYDKAGLLRAEGFLERLANEVSKAMRSDLDGKLDADKIEHLLAQIEEGVERIHARIEKITAKKKGKKKKAGVEFGIVKEAQKAPSINGIVITVPLLISRIARVCINGVVSAGHDLNDMYRQQCEKYDLNEREKAEVQQLLWDMNYPLWQERGFIADKENWEPRSEKGFDYTPNYPA